MKDNLHTAITVLAEAITAGVISTNGPKGKLAASMDEEVSYFSSAPLSQDTEPVTPLIAEEEEYPKENSPTPRTWEVPTTQRQRKNHRHPE